MVDVNYFDLGLWKFPHEIEMILHDVVPNLTDINFKIYGFEAHPIYAMTVQNRYQDIDFIEILNLAISDHNGQEKLFESSGTGLGCSIFKSKNNVSRYHYDVDSVLFSDWVLKNVSNFKDAINIVKINIEGAELYFYRDIVKADIRKYINIFAGYHYHDILKVKELEDYVDEYFKLIKNNNIEIHNYCGEVQGYPNVDMTSLIKKEIEKEKNG